MNCWDQSWNLYTYVKTNGTASSGITDNVGTDVSVCHGTQNHTSAGNEEASTVSNTSLLGSQEHSIADNDSGRGQDDEDLSLVNPPTDSREDESKASTDSVRRNTVELLLDNAVIGVDAADNGGEEESETLDSDVVEEEDEGDLEGDRVGNTAPELDSVDTVDDFGLGETFGLDTGDAEILLLLGEPAGCLGSVGKGDESEKTEADGNDTLNSKDHSPGVKATEVVKLENSTGKKTTKGTSKGSHNHVKRETESKLRALIPSGQVVGDSGQHASLEDSKQETNTAESSLGVAEGCGDTDDSKGERGTGEEPTGAHPFASDGGGDFEDDV